MNTNKLIKDNLILISIIIIALTVGGYFYINNSRTDTESSTKEALEKEEKTSETTYTEKELVELNLKCKKLAEEAHKVRVAKNKDFNSALSRPVDFIYYSDEPDGYIFNKELNTCLYSYMEMRYQNPDTGYEGYVRREITDTLKNDTLISFIHSLEETSEEPIIHGSLKNSTSIETEKDFIELENKLFYTNN